MTAYSLYRTKLLVSESQSVPVLRAEKSKMFVTLDSSVAVVLSLKGVAITSQVKIS